MDQIVSPDSPAYVCYLLVLAVGMLVAASSINQLLKDTLGRWEFWDTWALFFAHAAVPVLLFWFLDYTGAVRDTSLFAALVIAFGYQQVFAGGIQGILMPGQSARLWQPFEAWVNKVAARIAFKNRIDGEQYHDRVRRLVSQNQKRLQALKRLVFFYTKDATRLQTELTALAALPVPPNATPPEMESLHSDRLARKLIDELRSAEPQNYGRYLHRNGIINWYDWIFLLGKARSSLVSSVVTAVIAATLLIGIFGFLRSPEWQRRYYHWRLLKLNASEPDRFRSREFLQAELQRISGSTNAPAEFEKLYAPVLKPLRYRAVPLKQTDELKNFIFHSRVPGADEYLVPELVEVLAIDNLDVRMRVQQLLTEIQKASYTNPPVCIAASWQPGKEDSPNLIAGKKREWLEWWKARNAGR